jgi:putative endonuclease
MAEHNALGKEGEEQALAYLVGSGFRLRDKNWRFGKTEVDLVMESNTHIIMVEVKTRSADTYGKPEAFITKTKQQHLIKAANAYADQKGIDKEIRFDIVAITHSPTYVLEHIAEAFYP